MTVRYHNRFGKIAPDYICQNQKVSHCEPICQAIAGTNIDQAIAKLLLEAFTPIALESSLQIQEKLQTRLEEADRLRQKVVERAQYEANLVQRRYLHVDPANRLVADALEADWNDKLRSLAQAQTDYKERRQADRLILDHEQKASIIALATDFPRIWADSKTLDKDRKRMVRLLIEDVTVIKEQQLVLNVRFRGGATKTLVLPLALNSWQLRQTKEEVVKQIDKLLDCHAETEIAKLLNESGVVSGSGQAFHSRMVARLRRDYG